MPPPGWQGDRDRALQRHWAPRVGPSLAEASRRRRRSSRSNERLATADDRLAVDFDRRIEDDAVDVDGHLDGAADRGRGTEGDVTGAEDLLVLEDVAGQQGLFAGADPEPCD